LLLGSKEIHASSIEWEYVLLFKSCIIYIFITFNLFCCFYLCLLT
jgi:hypothetical protein